MVKMKFKKQTNKIIDNKLAIEIVLTHLFPLHQKYTTNITSGIKTFKT